MESENEVLAVSTPPALCIDEGSDEKLQQLAARDDIHSRSCVPNQVGDGGDEKAAEESPRKGGVYAKLPCVNLPDDEYKNMEMELMGAQERIEKLQFELVNAEKKLTDNQKEHSEEVSVLRHKLQSSVSIGEDKVKSLESEGARLVEELNASTGEVSDLKRHLQIAKQEHGELLGQVERLKEMVHMLEKQLVDLDERSKETKENLLAQVEVCQAELAKKAEAVESISKVHSDLQLELLEVKSKSEENARMVKEQVFNLEGMLKGAQDELKAKEAAASFLQAEAANSKSKLSELSTASEERLKQLEREHQEQLKAYEKSDEALQKSLLELEERTSQFQDSLGTARSDTDAARGRVAELELKVESLLQTKCKLEEGAAELQLQLKSKEEMLSAQVDSLKVAEENADRAYKQVEHVQSVLETTEETLRASEEAAGSLQQQVADLASKEASSAECLKEVENGSQKMQLKLQSKLEILEATMPQLEGKIADLQDSLSAAVLDGDGSRKKASELEVELASLQKFQGELEEKVRFSEENGSQHESTAHTLRTRVVELEGLITEYKTKADDLTGKVATLEADLVDTKNKATDLEMQLRLAQDNSLLLENMSAASIAELEKSSKDYDAKIEELQKVLAERQTEIDSATNTNIELKLFIGALESDTLEKERLVTKERTFVDEKLKKLEALTAKLEAEKNELESSVRQHKSLVEKGVIDLHEASVLEKKLRDEISPLQAAMSELQFLLLQTEEEKKSTACQLDSAMKSFTELNDQLVEERQQLQQQIATIMQENGDMRQKFSITQEKLHVALAAAELSAKQVQEGSLKESVLNAEVKDLNLHLKKALDACACVETLEQEKGTLAQKFASAQEKLHATIEVAELSARQLQAASLKDSALNAEIEDLKVQLVKAMDACSHVESLEQTLKNSVTREEHQTQIDQLVAASRLAESKLANVEEQLFKSKLEIKQFQKAVSEQETHVKELDPKTVKSMEICDQQPSDFTKTREMDLDVQSPGKVRNRKKKGVTWETDTTSKLKAVHEPQQHPVQSLNLYVAYFLIALVSLTFGFWFAGKVHS